MKIGIDAHRLSYQEIDTSGGVYISQLVQCMDKIAAGDSLFLYVKQADEDHVWPKGLQRCMRRPILGGDVIWRQLSLPMAALQDRVDVLFIPFHSVPICWPKRLVVAIHDVAFVKAPHCFPPKVRAYLRYVTAFAVRRASHIIAVSDATRDDLIEVYGTSPERITVAHLAPRPIFTYEVTEADSSVIQRFGINTPFFLFVGGADPRKNLPAAVSAFALLVGKNDIDFDFVVTGRGIEAEGFRVAPRVRERIKFIGYVATAELVALYSLAVALVYPSFYEGFGIPLVEAMSCGCPVIAADVSAIPEVVGDAGLLVDPRDPSAIAEAMSQCLSTPTRRSLREQGLRRSRQFSWEEAAAKVYRVLKSS